MKVDIICPLYEAEKYIEKLHNSLLQQTNVDINEIRYVLTKSSDNSENMLKKLQLNYKVIEKKDFSHSLIREKEAINSKADIICFITQDIVIEDNHWLEKLIEPILKNKVAAAYSRQITKFNNIEKYTREKNYPDYSFIKSKADIKRLGLTTFFFSDAASAIKRDVFVKLNGYDHKNLPINEDMYFAYKLIMNGNKIAYQANSVVYHSHKFSLKQLYTRYKLTGRFMKENSYLDKFGTNASGGKLAKHILKRAIEDRNIKVLIRYPFDMAARFIGMKVGKM